MDERINIVCETEKEFNYLTKSFINKGYKKAYSFDWSRIFDTRTKADVVFEVFVDDKIIDWLYRSSFPNIKVEFCKDYIRKEKLKRING